MQNPTTTETPEELAAALMAHGAKQLPDGSGLIIKDGGKAHLPPGWRNAPLCLQPCQVQSGDVHPGLHVLPKGGSMDDALAVCAKARGHPGSCLCYPGDEGRYGICPECKQLVAKRAIKAHIEAHAGINRKDAHTLKLAAQNDLADAIDLWILKNGGVSPDGATYLADRVREGRWNHAGPYVRGQLREFEAKATLQGWIPGFPLGLKDARKMLLAAGRTLYADGKPSGAQRVEEAKTLAAALRQRILDARNAATGAGHYTARNFAQRAEWLARSLEQGSLAPHNQIAIREVHLLNESLRLLGVPTVTVPEA